MQDPALPFQLTEAQMQFLSNPIVANAAAIGALHAQNNSGVTASLTKPAMLNNNPLNIINNPMNMALNGVNNSNKRISRHKFTPEEDEVLKNLVSTYGPTDWGTIATHFGNQRSARQCRDRWKHYISPEVVTGNWTEEDNQLLLQKHEEHGTQWSIIAKFFPGRTDIGVKNHFISISSKKGRDVNSTNGNGGKTHQRAVLLPTKTNANNNNNNNGQQQNLEDSEILNGEDQNNNINNSNHQDILLQLQEQMQQLPPEAMQQIQEVIQRQIMLNQQQNSLQAANNESLTVADISGEASLAIVKNANDTIANDYNVNSQNNNENNNNSNFINDSNISFNITNEKNVEIAKCGEMTADEYAVCKEKAGNEAGAANMGGNAEEATTTENANTINQSDGEKNKEE